MNPPGQTRRRGRVLAAAIALAPGLAIAMAGAPAAAQSSSPAGETPGASATEARSHFDRGVTFYDEGDFSAALVEFRRAYALSPTWQVLFNVGQSCFQMHDYAGALVTLRRFVDQGGERIPSERRSMVDQELTDLANRVGHVVVRSNLEGSTVTVDDALVGSTPLPEPLLVSVGIRKIAVVHDGARQEQEVSVAAGETVDVRLDYAAPSSPPAASSLPMESQPAILAPPPGPSRVPAVVAFGLGVAGAAVGGVFGGLALHDKSRLEGECQGKACAVGSRADIDAVSRDATLSTVAFAVLAAGAVAGIVLWITEGRTPHAAQGRAPARRQPDVSFRGGPGFITGSF
jgi:uncharacterized membrane protein